MASMSKQISEITELNEKSLPMLFEEYGEENPGRYLAQGKNFHKRIYYHNAAFKEDKKSILKTGFNFDKTSGSSNLGRGLFCGIDRQAVQGFYTHDLSKPDDFIVTIHGKFRFKSCIRYEDMDAFHGNFASHQTMVLWLHNNGYDGIRYYDPYGIGEEFVLYNLTKAIFS